MPGGVAGAQSIMTAPYADPLMCVTAQNLSPRMVIIALPKCRTKALVQNVCVRTDNRSVGHVEDFPDQMKRGNK